MAARRPLAVAAKGACLFNFYKAVDPVLPFDRVTGDVWVLTMKACQCRNVISKPAFIDCFSEYLEAN